jgi:iron-sulfur cluster assembly accessory protein
MEFTINITLSATSRIKHLIENEKLLNPKLRVSVESGGCSGMQYKYAFVSEAEPGDVEIVQDGVSFVIDSMSQEFLNQSTIDYIETLGSAYFEIRNPIATAKCGCGNSFAV